MYDPKILFNVNWKEEPMIWRVGVFLSRYLNSPLTVKINVLNALLNKHFPLSFFPQGLI